MGKHWTDEEKQKLRELFAEGKTDFEIAVAVGRKPLGVFLQRKSLRLLRAAAPSDRVWTDAEIQIVKDGIAARKKFTEIAKGLPGRTPMQAQAFAVDRLNHTTFHNKRFTPEDDEVLRTKFLAYVPYEDIANALGRSVGVTKQRIKHLGLHRDARRSKLVRRFAALATDMRPIDEVLAEIKRQESEAAAQRDAQEALRIERILAAAKQAVLAGRPRSFIFQKCLLAGATLQEIGDAFGITRERVRQVAHKVRRQDELSSVIAKLASLNPRDYDTVMRAVRVLRMGEGPNVAESLVDGGLAPRLERQR